MKRRLDLLQLTAHALSSLANRGLVKRAQKELAAGKVPEIKVLEDNTVIGTFEGDVETQIPIDTPLKDWSRTCAARGKCRHRVALVFAYQLANAESATGEETPSIPPFETWSPAEFDDEALTSFVGKRAMTRARSLRRKGYVATVRRAGENHPMPRVELATCHRGASWAATSR